MSTAPATTEAPLVLHIGDNPVGIWSLTID
jgi:hypothetical protein